jgi:hypothetical protein
MRLSKYRSRAGAFYKVLELGPGKSEKSVFQIIKSGQMCRNHWIFFNKSAQLPAVYRTGFSGFI